MEYKDREKIVAEVHTPQELYAALALEKWGKIVVCGHIVCEKGVVLTFAQRLIGRDENSCLEFRLEKEFNPVAVTMGEWTSLENLTLKVVVAADNVCRHYCCGVLIDATGVTFTNVCLQVETTGFVNSEEIPIFPAVYLRHFLEVFGVCRLAANGISASALSGDFSSTAQFCQRNGKLQIISENSRVPAIARCLLRVETGEFGYANHSDFAPEHEVFNAYVFLHKAAAFYNDSSCTVKMKSTNLCVDERELFFVKKQKMTEKDEKKSVIRRILGWFS